MKPILFSTEMVNAILDRQKTQTRRICKELENHDFKWGLDREPYIGDYTTFTKVDGEWDWVTLKDVWLYDIQTEVDGSRTHLLKPRYQVGDILWVRETFTIDEIDNVFDYKADCSEKEAKELKWKPSIFMPRKAARLFLRVTGVRVERVRDITEADARAEGVITNDAVKVSSYAYWFKQLWDSLNKKRGYGWETNPWVFVYEFERTDKP